MIKLLQKDIVFHITDSEVCAKAHIDRDSEIFPKVLELTSRVRAIMKPAFIIKEIPVEKITSSGLVAGGEFFQSKIAAHKMKEQKSVVAFIITCGREMGDYLQATEDALDSYIANQLAQMGCRGAEKAMLETLSTVYGVDRFIRLSPGSIIDWSVADVKKIFAVTDGMHQPLGIRVLDSGLIDPLISMSGMIVRSSEAFESCDICMRPGCPSRRSPFDQDRYDEMISL